MEIQITYDLYYVSKNFAEQRGPKTSMTQTQVSAQKYHELGAPFSNVAKTLKQQGQQM